MAPRGRSREAVAMKSSQGGGDRRDVIAGDSRPRQPRGGGAKHPMDDRTARSSTRPGETSSRRAARASRLTGPSSPPGGRRRWVANNNGRRWHLARGCRKRRHSWPDGRLLIGGYFEMDQIEPNTTRSSTAVCPKLGGFIRAATGGWPETKASSRPDRTWICTAD